MEKKSAGRQYWEKGPSADDAIFRLAPYAYMHVLDLNSNVTRLEIGPKTYVRQDNERVVLAPTAMVTVPPRYYCVVKNPVVLDEQGLVQLDKTGQVCLSHADLEVRLTRDPFPLYPGEELVEPPTELRVVPANKALRLKAVLDCKDEGGNDRVAGDEWLFEGPGTYIPRKEVSVEETIKASTIKPDQALMLRAKRELTDRQGVDRVTGEEWLVKKIGAYMPGAYEEVVKVVDAYVLVEKTALHVRATRSFKDQLGKNRKNGEEWLVQWTDAETYIPDVYERVLGVVEVTTLTNRQYCVVLDPVGFEGRPQLGKRKLVKGDKSFFLQPGESLERGIQSVYILGENDGVILTATEAFDDAAAAEPVARQPGDRWMIRGPTEYVPPVEVEVVCMRHAIPLDENEGIYVRDMKTGKVRAVVGQTYMLNQDEELWAKPLPPAVEELLGNMRDMLADRGAWREKMKRKIPDEQQESTQNQQQECDKDGGKKSTVRDKTKVVSLRVPHNAAVQIYDYKEKKARVAFGPDLVMLGPDEHFTQLSLSGGKPKRPNVIKSLCLLLGPDFCTDVITVETSDHARLSLQLSYNWHFDCEDRTDVTATKLFSVPDFIGDACKAIASRVRGMVAQVKFDEFHKHSARIIRTAVFGVEESGKVKEKFLFPQNNLVITSVDIQSVEPVDQRTRDSLQKSVQLAIEITTNSQEAAARHEAQRVEQEAKGRLERQRITDQAEAEKSRKNLLELQALSAAVESSGQAKAEAQSRAEAARIEGEAAVEQAKLKAEAGKIETDAELDRLSRARESELRYQSERDSMEVKKRSELAQIETEKFRSTVSVLGADTIKAIASSGTDNELKMLQALGLKTALITDGKSPINLLSTAHGLIGHMGERNKKTIGDVDIDDESSQ